MKPLPKRFQGLSTNIRHAVSSADDSKDIFGHIIRGFKDLIRHSDIYLEVHDIFMEQIIYYRNQSQSYRSCSINVMCNSFSSKSMRTLISHISAILKAEIIMHEKVYSISPNKIRIVLFDIMMSSEP